MKKRTLAFILFLAAVNFAGCVGQGAAVSDPLPRQQTSGAPAADQTEQLRFSRGTLTPGNEQGCYLVLPAPSGGASLLWYADYETQQLVELCTQPNCAHDNSSCTAWIPCPANIPRIAVAGEKLVLLFPGNPYFLDQYGEDALARIETRDLTGRFLKEVTRFTAGTALANEYAIGEHALYVFEADVAPETLQTIKTLIKVDLLSGKKETIASFQPENNEDYFWVGTTASEFIFKKISVRETAAETAEEMRLAQVHL